jgi:hypothetical protein
MCFQLVPDPLPGECLALLRGLRGLGWAGVFGAPHCTEHPLFARSRPAAARHRTGPLPGGRQCCPSARANFDEVFQ